MTDQVRKSHGFCRQTARPSSRMASVGKPNPIDAHVDMRVRFSRTLWGMSQEKLGDAIGLTF
jgi:hypothetical protein